MQRTKEEVLLQEFLATGRYLAFACKNNVSDSAIRKVAERLGFLTEDYDAKETKAEKTVQQ